MVCPLHNGVSRQTSANWPRLTCSSLAATFEKTIAPFRQPICCAATNMLVSPTCKKIIRNVNHTTISIIIFAFLFWLATNHSFILFVRKQRKKMCQNVDYIGLYFLESTVSNVKISQNTLLVRVVKNIPLIK